MKAYVGVTDGEWARFLAARPMVGEVNFWRPSSSHQFRVLSPGEPFFFKSHYPHNRIVGGGFYSGFACLPASEAWALYGEGNGASNLTQMRERIGYYRRNLIGPRDDPVIGCVLSRDVQIFPEGWQVDPPGDFASNIVQGKGYNLAEHEEVEYFRNLVFRLIGHEVEFDSSASWHGPGPVYGDPRLAPQRLGQTAFKAVVLDAYGGRCAVTGNKIRPVLQAAHILPLPKGGEHRLDNGILLRSDVHTLFDNGYLGVDPHYRLRVSPRLREEFGNGERYYRKEGDPVSLPKRRIDRPNREFLEWHSDVVFKA